MIGVANMLIDMGAKVSGSDMSPFPTMRQMSQRGAIVSIGHREEYVHEEIDLVIPSLLRHLLSKFVRVCFRPRSRHLGGWRTALGVKTMVSSFRVVLVDVLTLLKTYGLARNADCILVAL